MGTKADFYIGINNPEWIGSLDKGGEPWNIPCKILIQTNVTMFEETMIDFLTINNGIIKSNGDVWPWPWEDSKLTDYSYIFNKKDNLIYAYSAHEKIIFHPLMIAQGEDLNNAHVHMIVKFPLMGVGYGPNATKII